MTERHFTSDTAKLVTIKILQINRLDLTLSWRDKFTTLLLANAVRFFSSKDELSPGKI